ncbi:unnamed protein product, partial [marine sediment metagenome]
VVRKEILVNPYHLFNLRRLSARIIAYSFAFDPYMHHGPLYFTEIGLLRYQEPFFPILLFDYGVNLIPNAPNMSVWSHFAPELSIRIIDSVNQLFSRSNINLFFDTTNQDFFLNIEVQWGLISAIPP